ncbi:MAG TPA: hypothetical protein GXZ77_00725 [Papillibacter sp.]|mgnify:CR=1 FL=1|jgi:hypothetical protein|nr:hypothetical protein [Papillibacter sp.]
MHIYQRQSAVTALPGPKHTVGKVIHLPSCRKRKSLGSGDVWNIIFSVLAVATAVCVFLR